jgi:4-aminobutyrate aminotransferase
LVWKKAEGIYFWDADGNRYMDSTSGWFSAGLGHANERLTQAIRRQIDGLWSVTSGFSSEARERAVYDLCENLPEELSKVVFGTSGAEANEIVLHMVRELRPNKGIIVFEGSYHGKTYATRHLGGNHGFRKSILSNTSPVHVYHAEYPYPYRSDGREPASLSERIVDTLQADLEDPRHPMKNVGALIVEPAQGVGGFIVPPENFLKYIRDFCDQNDILMICDEVITGFGRCGPMFYSTGQGVTPDILVVGKGIANGLPLSAVVTNEELFDQLNMEGAQINIYSSTTAGNPLCCAVASEAIRIFNEDNLQQKSVDSGNYLRSSLESQIGNLPIIGEIRGTGMFTGIEMVEDKQSKKPNKNIGKELYRACLSKGLLINVGGSYGNVVKMAPPLIMDNQEIDELADIVRDSFTEVIKNAS